MSYNIGQFRRSQVQSYATDLTMTMGRTIVETTTGENVTFYDICGDLTGDNVLNSQNSYYLKFGVQQRTDSEQIFYLKIKNINELEDNEQLIEEFKVARGSDITYFEVIISPNATYNKIIWELQRTGIDYQISNQDGSSGRIMSISNISYTRLLDIITILRNSYSNLTYLTKIGVQGPPGLLMCINREQIRTGRNGIYELNNDNINITSLCFVPKIISTSSGDALEYFIVDFEY